MDCIETDEDVKLLSRPGSLVILVFFIPSAGTQFQGSLNHPFQANFFHSLVFCAPSAGTQNTMGDFTFWIIQHDHPEVRAYPVANPKSEVVFSFKIIPG